MTDCLHLKDSERLYREYMRGPSFKSPETLALIQIPRLVDVLLHTHDLCRGGPCLLHVFASKGNPEMLETPKRSPKRKGTPRMLEYHSVFRGVLLLGIERAASPQSFLPSKFIFGLKACCLKRTTTRASPSGLGYGDISPTLQQISLWYIHVVLCVYSV